MAGCGRSGATSLSLRAALYPGFRPPGTFLGAHEMSTTENPYGNDALGPANAPGSRDSFTLTAMIVYTGSNVVRCCLFDHFGIARAGGDGQRPVQAGRGRGGAGEAGERVECLTALPGCRPARQNDTGRRKR